MSDVLSKKQRSFCMSKIKPNNTRPELLLRSALWRNGARYRLKNKLPGKPDIIFPSKKVAIFVDGCFWHKCPDHYIAPRTRSEFWETKISKNVERDRLNDRALIDMGWITIRIWEHEIVQCPQSSAEKILSVLENIL